MKSIEYNSKTKTLEITSYLNKFGEKLVKGNTVELTVYDMADILNSDTFKPFLKLVKEESQE
jgi:hypothetical protein